MSPITGTRPGTARKILWAEMLRHELEAARDAGAVVILPCGSVEQHGPACPLDVDIAVPTALAIEAARRVVDTTILVAPPIWSGYTHYNQGFIGTISLRLETYQNLIRDICRSFVHNGFPRMILLNGHGGNNKPNATLAVDLSQEDVWPLAITYFDLLRDEMKLWGESDDHIGHGGEWETSLMLHLRPHLVDPARSVKEAYPEPFGELHPLAHFPERRRHTPMGVEGDGTRASAEKGARLFEAGVAKLTEIARTLARIELPRYHHHES